MVLTIIILLLFCVVPITAIAGVVVFCPLLILTIHLFLYNVIENTIESVSQMMFACAYVTIPLAHFPPGMVQGFFFRDIEHVFRGFSQKRPSRRSEQYSLDFVIRIPLEALKDS